MQKSKNTDVAQSLTKDFVGYGHYRLNVALGDGRQLSAITGDTELISKLDSSIDSDREEAIEEATKFVMSCNKYPPPVWLNTGFGAK